MKIILILLLTNLYSCSYEKSKTDCSNIDTIKFLNSDLYELEYPKKWAVAEAISFTSFTDTIQKEGIRTFHISSRKTDLPLEKNFIESLPELRLQTNILDTGSIILPSGDYAKYIEVQDNDNELGEIYGKTYFFTKKETLITVSSMVNYIPEKNSEKNCILDKMIMSFKLL